MVEIEIPWSEIDREGKRYRQKVQAISLVVALYEASLSGSFYTYPSYVMVDTLVSLMESLGELVPYQEKNIYTYMDSMKEKLEEEKNHLLKTYAFVDGMEEVLKKEYSWERVKASFLQKFSIEEAKPFHLIGQIVERNCDFLSCFFNSNLPVSDRAQVLWDALTHGLSKEDLRYILETSEKGKKESLIWAFRHMPFDVSNYLSSMIEKKNYDLISCLQELGLIDCNTYVFWNEETQQEGTVCSFYVRDSQGLSHLSRLGFCEFESYGSVEESIRFQDASQILDVISCDEIASFFALPSSRLLNFSEEHAFRLMEKAVRKINQEQLEKGDLLETKQEIGHLFLRQAKNKKEYRLYQMYEDLFFTLTDYETLLSHVKDGKIDEGTCSLSLHEWVPEVSGKQKKKHIEE